LKLGAAGAAAGTTFTDTATCAAGKVLFGGGGTVTITSGQNRRIGMVQSYPSSTTTWTVTGVAISPLGSGVTARATAYALCSQ
jgi:hypothetical protein